MKKWDKWISLCCTVVVKCFIIMDMLNLYPMINHCIRKILLRVVGLSLAYLLTQFNYLQEANYYFLYQTRQLGLMNWLPINEHDLP